MRDGCADQIREAIETGGQILFQMYAKRTAMAFLQNLKITACLRGLDDAKRVFLLGDRQVFCVIACDLQEYA